MRMYMGSNGTLPWNIFSNFAPTGVANLSQSVFEHWAFVKSGLDFKLFRDGVSVYSTTMSAHAINNVTGGSTLDIGRAGNNFACRGLMDDFRFTVGQARYSSDFTPPTESFPTP
jgi:hypothetical protein